jgi:uncharacterized protein (TIGR02145 family)
MKKAIKIITVTGVFMLLFSFGNISAQTTTKSTQTQTKTTQTTTKSTQTKTKSTQTTKKSTQTKPKSTQPVTKTAPVPKPKDTSILTIGAQNWSVANLSVNTFRNGDSIPEARTNEEWVKAGESGKPAWCYYNNDPKHGQKYGKLYNWFAVNDPRELAPAGWTLASDEDWAKLTNFLGGQKTAGTKMKTVSGWGEGDSGTNESGFAALPAGYRVENGTFMNLGSIATWWSTTESKTFEAIDHYITQSGSLARSSTPKQRGQSVRCLKK